MEQETILNWIEIESSSVDIAEGCLLETLICTNNVIELSLAKYPSQSSWHLDHLLNEDIQ